MSNRSWGLIILCLWLIAMGATMMLDLHFNYQGLIMGALAIAAGVLLLLGK